MLLLLCASKNTKTYNKMQRAPFLPPTDRERTAEREKKWQQKYDECLEYIHNNRFIHTQTHTLSALTEWAKSQCNWKLNLIEQIKSYQPNTAHSTPSIFAVVVAALNVIAFLLYLIGFLSKNRCYFVCFKLEKNIQIRKFQQSNKLNTSAWVLPPVEKRSGFFLSSFKSNFYHFCLFS